MEKKESRNKWIGLGTLLIIITWLFIDYPVVMAELTIISIIIWCLLKPRKKIAEKDKNEPDLAINGKEEAAKEHERYLAEVNEIIKEKSENTESFYAQAEKSAEFVKMENRSWKE